ncbi:NB-ARC domain-containing protein [Lentzea jiangxiensis]|uniref:NB-ARC domain-containing protein n=2 Tax=Lentzea jiangxiensis TaxID=641025 RepID=A0A1H0X8G7_9PSEU|nr:XRE family transcriptional regulator [Lentzea jiangxiensis]SDP99045.1 NB-ARC domain-containing protein [Lentzea jiangxiensis]
MVDATVGSVSEIGVLLRKYRVRAGLTQEELANRSGVSVRAISDMERGVARSPQRRTIDSLAGPLSLRSDEIAQLHKSARRSRAATPSGEPVTPRRIFDSPVVAQLPPDLHDLTGREQEIEQLRRCVETQVTGNRTGRVVVLSGAPGTGKTSLAIRAAHDLADHFPDGQMFLKLRGMSEEATSAADVLHLVLRSLGIDISSIPVELEHLAGLCRSLLAERAVLIVLDDAADEGQVRPLLVGGPRSLTLVTSRHVLAGLEGAGRLSLDVLAHHQAVALVGTIIGTDRVEAEAGVADELVELCGRLPLAIRIAANRLASRPAWPLSHLVSQLRGRSKRLRALTAGDLDIRSVFDLSYRQLRPITAAVFRRVALIPGSDFSVTTARVLLDARREDDIDLLLDELVDASLVQLAPAQGRYQLHDLLCEFAKDLLAEKEEPETVREVEKHLDHWLMEMATAAGRFFQPCADMETPPVATSCFDDALSARKWLEAEAGAWSGAIRRLAARGDHRRIVDLADAMCWYPEFGGTADLWYEVFDQAMHSAILLGSKKEEAARRN